MGEGLPEGWARWEVEAIQPGGRRTADELMLMRGKLVASVVSRRVLERPAGSRLRRRFLDSAVRGGFALLNRRDYQAMLDGLYTDDCELIWDGIFLDAGSEGVQHGTGEVSRYLRELEDAYSSVIYRPVEITDAGGHLICVRVDTLLTGRLSGIQSRVMQGIVYELEAGRIRRQQMFIESDAALQRLSELAA